MLKETDTAVAYNPVASQWKGNAVAPATLMATLGIRFGIGTDGTRSDGFRLVPRHSDFDPLNARSQ
jgi:5-methylthioadenosine/S-adenosylhomocysteine deaminase